MGLASSVKEGFDLDRIARAAEARNGLLRQGEARTVLQRPHRNAGSGPVRLGTDRTGKDGTGRKRSGAERPQRKGSVMQG